jgi:transcriptional regulator with GAF, ATPase, and Fis domain
MEQALSYYQEAAAKQGGLASIMGESPPIRELKASLRQLLEAEQRLENGTPPAVLITGETGTGKELVARALHFDGKRCARPFIEINCASIPPQLLEAELFGYERGAFTDARGRKLGLAETADGGTLFLDEIGDVEPVLQGKLLKLLEEKVVRRLGSLRDAKVDVRVVAATNRPLEQWVREGKFRSDLYFRLRGVQLVLPPLRSRGEDILSLARDFLTLHSARYGKKRLRFSERAEKALLDYVWPGNVRELRNVIEETVLLANTEIIQPEQLSMCAMLAAPLSAHTEGAASETLTEVPGEALKLDQMERNMLMQTLEKTDWNVTRAAKLLGLSRDTLRYRIEKYDLTAEHEK